MIRNLIVLLILWLPFHMISQEIERIKIRGQVTAPVGEDIEGISVYNLSSQKGSITNAEGVFELAMAENDRLSISALQFSTFTVIVDKGIIESASIGIYLNPVVNQLAEVIVRPYDLSGNVAVDVGRIKTANVVPHWDLSYEALEFGYEFSDDQYSSIDGNKAEEAFFNGQQQASLNFVGLAGLLFPKKKKKNRRQDHLEQGILTKNLRQRFSNSYISEIFDISPELANDFIYFAEENGLERDMLKEQNEVLLLSFMFRMSKAYKDQRNEE